MAAAQLFLPASRAFNSNGLPVAGAVLKLYTTGTLIPQPIYSDSALTISLGSSVTANAAGRFQTVYQDNATAFRLRIEDATGAELDDIDPYYFGTMLFSATFSELASFTTRALLAAVSAPTDKQVAYLTEVGREGAFVFSTANLSTKVTADPLQGLLVAPAADTTGASGAWVRKFNGSPHINWWGAIADYNGTTGTDNASVFAAVQTAIQAWAIQEPDVGSVWYTGRTLSFRDGGRYYTTAPLSIIIALTEIDFTGSQIIVPPNTKAIVVNTDTTDDESTRTSGPFPYEITLINPTCRGTSIGTDRNKPLIWLRAKAIVNHPDLEWASGDLVRIGDLNGHTAGNQDGWRITNLKGQRCGGSGVHAEGADASAGKCDNYHIGLCGRFAIVDLSANGNKWNGQSAFCGVLLSGVNTVPAFVYHAGTGHNWAIIAGQEANTTVTPSSARPDVWIDCGVGTGTDPALPNWTSGITMEAGGSVRSLGGTGNAQFDHCYFETGSFSCWQLNTNSVIRDFTGSNLGIGGVVEYANNSGLVNYSSYTVQNTDATGTSSVLLGGTVDHFALWESAAGGNAAWHWQYSGGYLRMRDGGGHDSIAINPTTGRWYIIDTEAHYRVNGIQVVGAQQAAIADDASGAANQAKLNAVLAALRAHGIIAT